MEDGCPKRFDLNMSFNAPYATDDNVKTEDQPQQSSMMPLQSPYVTGVAPTYVAGPSSGMTQYHTDYMGQDNYGSNPGNSWTS